LRTLPLAITITERASGEATLADGRTIMAFTALFIAHVPDADPGRDRSLLETSLYRLFSVLVQNTDQALAVCRELVAEEGVQSVLLCPGNTHYDVAQIAAALGDEVSVSVARGDSRSMRVAAKAMEEAGWFSQTRA
jgi:Family of unknown function (DUF6506)